MATKAVTDASFQADVLDSDKPVLVDFWADWCGPCKMIAPALEEISDELAGQVTIAKMDIMENPEVPGPDRRAVDPADGAVQGRQAGRAEARRRAQEPAQGLARERALSRRAVADRPAARPTRPTARARRADQARAACSSTR